MSIIRYQLESKIVEVVELIQIKTKKILSVPCLHFRQMGILARLAEYLTKKVFMNSDFCQNGHWDGILNSTLPHEVATLVSYQLFGDDGMGHKRKWQSVMGMIGLEPKRCHDYSFEGVKTRNIKRINYTCDCGRLFPLSMT